MTPHVKQALSQKDAVDDGVPAEYGLVCVKHFEQKTVLSLIGQTTSQSREWEGILLAQFQHA